MARNRSSKENSSTATIGFEASVPVRKDLANGSMSSNQSGDCNARSARRDWATNSQGLGSQRDIRRALIEADLVDCMVALPGQIFYSTQIPVCLWFIEKNGNASAKRSAFKTAQIQYNDAMGKAHSNFQLT